MDFKEIKHWYQNNFEDRIKGRFLPLHSIEGIINTLSCPFKNSVEGYSEKGQNIYMVTIGKGSKKVLAWSQMHGNESTTTKALMDFFKFCDQTEFFRDELENLFSTYTLYVVPMLNPDGAENYTRVNANGIDLNRDAKNLSQSESRVLRELFDRINPNLCLNLHDQRSIYGLNTGLPASISFLSPSADVNMTITPARANAMAQICKMNAMLQEYLPGQIGRYDDKYNANCVGDSFSEGGVPTILFEAGHLGMDYMRENTREYIFYSFLSLLDILPTSTAALTASKYLEIPQNSVNWFDFILRNARLEEGAETVSIGIIYEESLKGNTILFEPKVDKIGDLSEYHGHLEADAKNAVIITDLAKKVEVDQRFSKIFNKGDRNIELFTINLTSINRSNS